jgi:Cdc6-like AAA superfamily ATPase
VLVSEVVDELVINVELRVPAVVILDELDVLMQNEEDVVKQPTRSHTSQVTISGGV